jgi:hypothetical protein
MVAEKAGGLGRRDHLQALFVKAIEQLVAPLHVIEDAECNLTHSRSPQTLITFR